MDDEQRRFPNILLGVTGSVAAVKGPEVALRLVEWGARVKILLSVGGENFWEKCKGYDRSTWDCLKALLEREDGLNKVEVIKADQEWKGWNRLGDPVLHIDLREWADLFLIAPLSAHTLAKISNGLCDDTLSCVARAWRFDSPMILAPAMNTAMWEHPVTAKQLDAIRVFSVGKFPLTVIEPASKMLACGEIGVGALAAVGDIMSTVQTVWENAEQVKNSKATT